MGINEWLLRKALEECANLINATFLFKFDYKGTHIERTFIILKKNFYHLLGFSKLTDLSFLSSLASKQDKAMLFQAICDNNDYVKAIAASTKFREIEGKLLAVLRLKNNLLSNNISMFKFDAIERSVFNCDWLLKCINNRDCMFYGLVNCGFCVLIPNSAFTDNKRDYSKNSAEVENLKIEYVDPVLYCDA